MTMAIKTNVILASDTLKIKIMGFLYKAFIRKNSPELRAKSKIKNDKDHVLYEDDVIDIFPELKESEDEKIRKDLIQWIVEFPDTIWRGHYKKDILAWLKKQGDQKPAWSEEDEKMENMMSMICRP